MTRMGFFTDTSICIGCKACEVACKEWNDVPAGGLDFLATSYDNTGSLNANAWRHVAFIESRGGSAPPTAPPDKGPDSGSSPAAVSLDTGTAGVPLGAASGSFDWPGGPAPSADSSGAGSGITGIPSSGEPSGIRWLMSSDVCKHCTHAACLDVCPTGALFRTEFDTVVIQQDVCNGCGYCVPACPFGVIDKRESDGRVWKCTLCYDRLKSAMEPACSTACPTQSIRFGPLDELRDQAAGRVGVLRDAGVTEAHLYGADGHDGVGGFGAFFLLLDAPEIYGLPPDPVVTTRDLARMWRAAGGAAVALVGAIAAACVVRPR